MQRSISSRCSPRKSKNTPAENFSEPWFELAFAPADQLKPEQKREILERAFQVNEIYVQRWPRFSDLQAQVRSAGAEACAARFNEQDWRDLQLLSQLAWMDEEYIAKDPVVNLLAAKGTGYHRAR